MHNFPILCRRDDEDSSATFSAASLVSQTTKPSRSFSNRSVWSGHGETNTLKKGWFWGVLWFNSVSVALNTTYMWFDRADLLQAYHEYNSRKSQFVSCVQINSAQIWLSFNTIFKIFENFRGGEFFFGDYYFSAPFLSLRPPFRTIISLHRTTTRASSSLLAAARWTPT